MDVLNNIVAPIIVATVTGSLGYCFTHTRFAKNHFPAVGSQSKTSAVVFVLIGILIYHYHTTLLALLQNATGYRFVRVNESEAVPFDGFQFNPTVTDEEVWLNVPSGAIIAWRPSGGEAHAAFDGYIRMERSERQIMAQQNRVIEYWAQNQQGTLVGRIQCIRFDATGNVSSTPNR